MASQDESGRLNGDGQALELAALTERVGRLETELAALRRQAGRAGEPAASVAAAEIAATYVAPPPPPPMVVGEAAAGEPSAPRLVSEAWASSRPQPFAAAAQESRDSFESQLGSQIFNRIAIVLLLIGAAYFLKLAVDRGWIGPMGRVLAGLIAGTGLVVWSERFRAKGFAAFSYSLKAVGSGVLYLTLWAAFHLFGLIPGPVALVLMVLVTAWNAYMAWAQDAELLAAYALAGGFATPLLLSTGENHEIFLFSYILAIDVAMVALVRLRGWYRLLLGAFPLTVAFFAGWYSQWYDVAQPLGVTAVFAALFGAVFASAAVSEGTGSGEQGTGRPSTVLGEILLPLGNAVFVALAGYRMLEDAGHHGWLPWWMVVLAAAYLALMRLPQTALAAAIHLSLAVVFLTIAIPLKASGHWITVSWLVEGLALLWVATRLRAEDEAGEYAATTLRWLALGSLALGFCGVCVHLVGALGEYDQPLLNHTTGTALAGIAVFAAAAWLALRAGEDEERRAVWGGVAMAAVGMIGVTAAMMTLREVGASWIGAGDQSGPVHLAFRSADFVTALVALGIFAGLVAVCLRVADERADEEFWKGCAATGVIVFNAIAVLTGVREVSALFAPAPNVWSAEAGLQQALAISGFLMLYGAALLAAGFWKRSGFLRWQGLILLMVTIFKTFLHDLWNLSQGYRVASLMGLGALLLAISFAYQKDWLNLRGTEKSADSAGVR